MSSAGNHEERLHEQAVGQESQETAAPDPGEAAEQPPGTAAPGQPMAPSEEQDVAGQAAAPPGETGAPGHEGAPEDGSGEVVDELTKARRDLAELTADLQRLQAEYVNYKRRVDRDRELVQQNARFSVLSALLPVLDDLDRAREHGELEGGFKAVADSLERIVSGMGLVKFGEPGDEFDPTVHEALMHSHSPEVTTTTCQTIVHAGYRIGERVVRPARVIVVDPEPADVPDGDESSNQSDE